MIWCLSSPGKNLLQIQQDFWSVYPHSQGRIETIQKALSYFLKDFSLFCEELKINFWLHGGSLIGAIRHNGFIPWDDDIDIALTRKDFTILRDSVEKSQFILEELYNDIYPSRGYQLRYRNEPIPVFLDIVIFDFIVIENPTVNALNSYLEKFRLVQREVSENFHNFLHAPQLDFASKWHYGVYSAENKKSVDLLFECGNKKLEISNNGNAMLYALENFPFPYPVMLVNEITPFKKIKFEGITVNIPNSWKKYLDGYGNIYEVPASMEINSHMYALEKDYQEIDKFCKQKRAKEL